MAKGDGVILGDNPDGMETEFEPVKFVVKESYVNISFDSFNSTGELEDEVQALFDGSDISTEWWLTANGSHSLTPC